MLRTGHVALLRGTPAFPFIHPQAVAHNFAMLLTVIKAPKGDVYSDTVRVPERFRKDPEGHTIAEGTVCRMSVNGASMLVILRGMAGETKTLVSIEEKLRNDAGITAGRDFDFDFVPVGIAGELRWLWAATHPAYRIANRLGVLSFGLGLLSILLALYSIWLTFRPSP